MTKVVINTCYGGFSLSNAAISLLQAHTGATGGFGGRRAVRHDPELVKIVEDLGGRDAGGGFAFLEVVDIGDADRYRIGEYDGMEWVETPDTIEWVNV